MAGFHDPTATPEIGSAHACVRPKAVDGYAPAADITAAASFGRCGLRAQSKGMHGEQARPVRPRPSKLAPVRLPEQCTEPLEDASHVRNAVAGFDQVKDVSDAERDEAWKRITAAAKRFDVELEERSWRELGKPKG